ncbi:metallophosphoesterase [Streptomyces sp. WMMB 714]|uniref:metallophosphoesterase n=1 Tax=Streptomyces sp. WMMB 714 TaxID=1286822 RepID=UPI0005F7D7D0|nr:metallophosphoesterase [Streptomyces sp. WMMB 714]
MPVVFVLVVLAIFCLLGAAHWYLWRRLVRDVSVRGGAWRRAGTVLAFALPVLTVLNFVLGRSDIPFAVQQVLAWPGFMWVALLLYLMLALLAGEVVRPLLLRFLERRAAAAGVPDGAAADGAGAAARPGAEDASSGGVADGDAVTGTGSGSAEAAGAEAGGAVACATATGTKAAAGGGGTSPGAGPDGGSDGGSDGGTDGDGAGKRDRSKPAALSRRLFVARTIAAGASVAAAGTVGAGAYGLLNGPTLKRITVPLTKLPRAAHGYRIAVVSDIHIGAVLGRGHTQRIVDTINSAQPDMIAIVGDLVDGDVEDLAPAAEPLRRLRARDGSFFVTGNHEYFGDAGEWVDHVRELGVHPLENDRREMPGFDLAGVNDVRGEESGDGPDFDKALGDRDTSRASVLLAHQPVQIHDAVDHGVDLQLSGHSHGGQMWPGQYLAALANPTVAGLERYGDTQLYVTRGAGAWGPPVRVGAESDVTIVQLASKKA